MPSKSRKPAPAPRKKRTATQFIQLRFWFLEKTGLSLDAKVLAALLDDYRNEETGQLNPKLQSLAIEMALTVRAVRRALAELIDVGIVTRVGHGQRSDRYALAPISEWPKLAGLKVPRVAKSNRANAANFDRAEAPHLLIDSDLLTQRKREAVVDSSGGEQHRRKQAATAARIDEIDSPIETTMQSLYAIHPERWRGSPEEVRKQLGQVLRSAPDPYATAAQILAVHKRAVAVWEARAIQAAKAKKEEPDFVALSKWIKDGDWRYPHRAVGL